MTDWNFILADLWKLLKGERFRLLRGASIFAPQQFKQFDNWKMNPFCFGRGLIPSSSFIFFFKFSNCQKSVNVTSITNINTKARNMQICICWWYYFFWFKRNFTLMINIHVLHLRVGRFGRRQSDFQPFFFVKLFYTKISIYRTHFCEKSCRWSI
jgi:hypothetical protein